MGALACCLTLPTSTTTCARWLRRETICSSRLSMRTRSGSSAGEGSDDEGAFDMTIFYRWGQGASNRRGRGPFVVSESQRALQTQPVIRLSSNDFATNQFTFG